jgi:hypothetical protein
LSASVLRGLMTESEDLVDIVDYYERLLDFLVDIVPNIEDVIELFDEKERMK